MDPKDKQVNHKTKETSIPDRERDRTNKFQPHSRFSCHRRPADRPPSDRKEETEGPTKDMKAKIIAKEKKELSRQDNL